MGIARMIERAGADAGIGFPAHVHMLRHSTGIALANKRMDTRRLQHYLGHASITNTIRNTAMSPFGDEQRITSQWLRLGQLN
jgi:type 1 fimbriae regulatory protein FimB/type 1 fimbriae regulatory protein FimE